MTTLTHLILVSFLCCLTAALPVAVKSSCSPNPCQNGGFCQSMFGQEFCSCLFPFYGQKCEYRGDVPTGPPPTTQAYRTTSSSGKHCHPGACGNGGYCVDTSGGFYCKCPYPFTGPYCCDFDMPSTFNPSFPTFPSYATSKFPTWNPPTFPPFTYPTGTYNPTFPTGQFPSWPTNTYPPYDPTKYPTGFPTGQWETSKFTWAPPSVSTGGYPTVTQPPFTWKTSNFPTFPSFGPTGNPSFATSKFPTFPTYTYPTSKFPSWSTTNNWPSWGTTPMDPCRSRTDSPWNLEKRSGNQLRFCDFLSVLAVF